MEILSIGSNISICYCSLDSAVVSLDSSIRYNSSNKNQVSLPDIWHFERDISYVYLSLRFYFLDGIIQNI